MQTRAAIPRITELQGLWRRSLIAWPDGRRDETTNVHYLQGPSRYADLRCPLGRPDFSHTRRLNDLAVEQIVWLATQEGFAGTLVPDGDAFEWRRTIDFQPATDQSDAGHLWFEADLLIEQGRDIPYIEHWHRENGAPHPCAALHLRQPDTGVDGFIVRVGDTFMYARDRAAPLPRNVSLAQCVGGSGSPAAARAMIDCEISAGRIQRGVWTIEHSSLPFREGRELALMSIPGGDGMLSSDIDADGVPLFRDWRIVAAEGAAATILNSLPPLPRNR
jgi:hypothetical protein